MLLLKSNYKGSYKRDHYQCDLCKSEADTQEHLLMCPRLSKENTLQQKLTYNDLFSNDVKKITHISPILEKKYLLKKELEN